MSTSAVWVWREGGEANVGFAIPPKTQLIYVSGRASPVSRQHINWQIFISLSTGKIYGDQITVLLETVSYLSDS